MMFPIACRRLLLVIGAMLCTTMVGPAAAYASFTPEMSVIDTRTYAVVARVPQASPFSPNLAVSPDGTEVWLTLKDVGKTQVVAAEPPFRTLATLDTGPITNHVALVDNRNGHFAYVTIGGTNEVKVYCRGTPPALVATIATGDLPHGIWPAGDGSRVYVSLEHGDAVQAIDTLSNTTIAKIPAGQLPQAIVYVPGAVPTGPGTENLVTLDVAKEAQHLELGPPAAAAQSKARASLVVNHLGQVDHLQIAASGLEPGREYELSLVDSQSSPAQRIGLAKFKASMSGTAIAQALGPIRELAGAGKATTSDPARWRIVVVPVGSNEPVLVGR